MNRGLKRKYNIKEFKEQFKKIKRKRFNRFTITIS